MTQLHLDGVPKTFEVNKERVEEILEIYPEARGDDNLLFIRYYKHFFDIDFPNLKGKPLPSTLTRCRRKIQEAGKFCAPKVKKVIRKMRQEEVRNHFSVGKGK
jgi:hypothetical protein